MGLHGNLIGNDFFFEMVIEKYGRERRCADTKYIGIRAAEW